MTTTATPGADSAARQDLLERYAGLAIRVGINLEPGCEVAIRAMIERNQCGLLQTAFWVPNHMRRCLP